MRKLPPLGPNPGTGPLSLQPFGGGVGESGGRCLRSVSGMKGFEDSSRDLPSGSSKDNNIWNCGNGAPVSSCAGSGGWEWGVGVGADL